MPPCQPVVAVADLLVEDLRLVEAAYGRIGEPLDAMDDREASYEVRHDGEVVGPVSLDQIRRGVAAGKIPLGSEARRVTAWQSVALIPMIQPPPGGDRRPCIEIRHGDDVVGPVSLYQVRKGLVEAMIPDGSQARVVWRWTDVARLLDKGAAGG